MIAPPLCEIPAGSHRLGENLRPLSSPAHSVMLAAFAIAEYAVTNAQFRAFMADGGYDNAELWTAMGWRWLKARSQTAPAFMDDPRFNHDWQPVIGVTWYEADAFARWLALATAQPWRLPTEAEWEAAAAGIHIDRTTINSAERGLGRPWSALGSGQVAACGARDLLGNVWEWCSTRWGKSWQSLDYPYPYNAYDGREEPDSSYARVMRGGSWFDALHQAHPAARGRYLPGSRASKIGFRLAISLC